MTSNLDETLYFNGVNGATGGYFFEPQTVSDFSKIVQQSSIAEKVDGSSPNDVTSDPHLRDLINRHRDDSEDKFDVIEGVDPNDLSDTGWGIIFPSQIDPAIRDALSELIEHRKQEAGEYFQEYQFFPGETAYNFLSQRGAKVFDPADPSKVPYYLLIVGDFHEIPFDFQYQLDVQYAVGRIYFKTPQEYAQYAHSVVQAEKSNLSLPCKASLFGVSNPGDRATELSTEYLVKPLQEFLTSDKRFQKNNSHWNIETYLEEAATKAQLSQLLGGKDTPAFLFTASHGVGFPKDDPRQLPHQGALVCQDWPGSNFGEPVPKDFYFSADDIADNANLLGLISFHFACFGAGTPQKDEFGHRNNSWQEIAPRSFMANLPQKLLSKGALAFVGHVDRAWGYSFGGKQEQLTTFKSTLQRLTEGNRLGRALECFNERYAAVSSELTTNLWYIKAGKKSDDYHLSLLWTTNNDARGYAIIGDPAVRLMVGNNAFKLEQRPEIESIQLAPKSSPDQSNDSDKSDESDVTPDSALPPEKPPENPIEKELSNLVNVLNDLSQRVEGLKQKNLTEDNLFSLKGSLNSFENTVEYLEKK
ncbi:MAG: hypothetical protein WBB43_09330 [Limnoraphis sp.]